MTVPPRPAVPAGASGTAGRGGPVSRRPRDRKAQIIAAAMDRFHHQGYHATGMEDIASAAGITASALYWHFRGKGELLEAVVVGGLERVLETVRTADGLDAALGSLAALIMENRAFGALWQREYGSLTPQTRARARQVHAEIAGLIAAGIRAERPGVGQDHAELIAWAVIPVLASPTYHRVESAQPSIDVILHGLARAVCDIPEAPPAPSPRPSPYGRGPGLSHVSRRRRLLTAAVQLFSESGFSAIAMEDIGRAAGISGPAVYHHFAGKSELLAEALGQALAARHDELNQALLHSADPRQALLRVLRAYATSTTSVRGHAQLLTGALAHLPAEVRRPINRAQAEYVAEWAGLLRNCRPELGEAEAVITVHAAFAQLNFLSAILAERHSPDPVETMTALATRVLGLELSR
ncbi:TetR/AcrR family transcriptional regulator [Streptomyces adustus]|uniref:TetR/AcrR family transcriptional regulator n=1 Tax=Streptomyces adustus TaxID=1609272 RepID=UPI003722DCA8